MYCRVLLVDDDSAILHALRRELMRPPLVGTDGIEIESFTSAAEALTRAAQAESAFDVAIVDYRMPDMDGITLLNYLRRLQPETVRILLTGMIDFDGAIAAINDARVDHLLPKPWYEYDLKGRIALALHQRQLVRSLSANSMGPVADAQPIRLLIVDDEPGVVHALEREISLQGRLSNGQRALFEIKTASSAALARKCAESFHPDVIIADYQMPDGDGIQLLNEMRQRFPSCVRILMSGSADLATLSDAINIAGVYHFIAKPWAAEALRALLAEALRYRQFSRAQPGGGQVGGPAVTPVVVPD